MTEIKKALRRLLGHRARFSYDGLLDYLVMNALQRYKGKVSFALPTGSWAGGNSLPRNRTSARGRFAPPR
jgi:hypothetical protein